MFILGIRYAAVGHTVTATISNSAFIAFLFKRISRLLGVAYVVLRTVTMKILGLLESISQDTQHAFRDLRRKPAFTTVVVLSLALGIGVNTAIFAVADAVLLRPLPFPDPDGLVVLTEEMQQPFQEGMREPPELNIISRRSELQSFEAVMGFGGGVGIGEQLVSNGGPRTLFAGPATASMCSIYRVQPRIGRCFTPEEEAQEAPVALLSFRLWQSVFAGDPGVVGRTMSVRGEPRDTVITIVGVMPEGFRNYAPGSHEDMWVPVPLEGGPFTWGQALGRLKPGVDIRQARAELQALQRRVLPNDHEGVGGMRLVVQTLQSKIAGDVRTGLWVLLSAAGLVLLIACANVASLLLGRGIERAREVAVRESLGAGRVRLCRQFLTESIVLAVLGGVLGVAGAHWMLQGIQSVAFEWLPRLDELQMNLSVFVFSALASTASALLFGLLPALRLSRVDLVAAMKAGSSAAIGGRHQQTAMSGLVIFQTTICMVAMMGAGLLINTVIRLNTIDLGIQTDHAASVSIQAPRSETAVAFFGDVLGRVQALPSVQAAGTTNILPLDAGVYSARFRLPGMAAGTYRLEGSQAIVSPGYFEAAGTSILTGRLFDSRDQENSKSVVIISEALARKYWPDGKALGKTIIMPVSKSERTYEIIGVAADVRNTGLRRQPVDHIYRVYTQGTGTGTRLIVRTHGEPAAILPALKDAIRAVDKYQTLDQFATLDAYAGEMVEEPRFYMIILGTFAGLALGLTALGVGGLAAYSVRRRTREVGLRISFGATAGNLYRMFGMASLRLVAVGLALGAVLSLAVTQYVKTLLFEVTPTDPITFVVVGAILTAVALTACGVAARRATTIDPVSVLRED